MNSCQNFHEKAQTEGIYLYFTKFICVVLAMKYPSFHYVDFSTWCFNCNQAANHCIYCSDKTAWVNPTKSSRVWYTSGFSFWTDVVETGRHTSSKTRLCNPCLLSITLQMNIRALSSMKGQEHHWSKDNFIIRLELFIKCIVRGKPQSGNAYWNSVELRGVDGFLVVREWPMN